MSGFHLSLREAALALGLAPEPGWNELPLTGISTDTRALKPGELFIALKGENFDGHKFLDRAFAGGAAAAVIQNGGESKNRIYLTVPDTLKALGDLAAYFRRRRPLKVAALTGSNGKTTTKELLVNVLRQKYRVLATVGNFNNLIGLPLTLFRLRDDDQAAVLEMGMNRPGEISRLTEIANPDVALVTNVGPAHLEGLGSLEGVAQAKGELYRALRNGAQPLVNMDDPLVVRIAGGLKTKPMTYGFSPGAAVRAEDLHSRGLKGMGFNLVTPAGKIHIEFPLFGRHSVTNALAAAAAGLAMGVSLDQIRLGLEAARAFPGRLVLKKLPGPLYLLDDTYNANPVSMRAALHVLRDVKGRGRMVAVLGDMFELGRDSAAEHGSLGEVAADLKLDLLIGVGHEAEGLIRAAEARGLSPERLAWFNDREQAAAWLASRLKPNDRVLIKGSRGMEMERLLASLAGKIKGR